MTDKKPDKLPRQRIDWEAVELAYRLGVESLRAIGANHHCAESAIRKKAKEQKWCRDLSAKVKAKAEDLVRKAEVRKEVRTQGITPTEREQIEISAQVQTNIILAHRSDVPIARKLTMQMFTELAQQTSGIELLEELGDLMRQPSESGQDKLNDLYKKIIALPSRADTLKKLSESLKTQIALEREAFGLNSEQENPANDPLSNLLARITGGNNSGINPVAEDPDHDD